MHLWRTAEDHATPTVWTQLWQSMLNRLGWPGSERQLDSTAVTAWERALTELSGLTPIVGSISAPRALQELEHVLGRPQTPGPTGMRGISLLGQLEDLGVGYDAVWVSGLTDSHWPCAARPNPLLPLALQSAHGMPLATPRQALDHCRQTTGRLLARAPELVLSWPARVQECPAHASPLILGVPEADAETLLVPASAGRRRQLLNSRARRMDSDSAPPLTRREISGGANTLRLQSLCPLRAFVETRLGARPMEPATRGLSRLQRGIVAHRTMELLLRQLPRQIELSEWPPAARASSIGNCVDTALHETLGPVLRPLKWLFDLERARLIALAQGLVTLDLKRGQFEVAAVEEPHVVELGGRRVRCRIDRVDVLTGEDGRQGLAVIDYKTGAGAGPADWFRGRLRDTQIPLYATALGAEVVAAVVGLLKYDDIRYRGLWAQPGQFPGRMMPLPDRRPWRSQIAVWREQLETLVGEYARGDTRILLADAEQARGALAPLTRAYEQEALARGWVRGSGPA
jgi:probable DNA repair protein